MSTIEAISKAEPHYQVLRLECSELHLELPVHHQPSFTVEDALSLACETAVLSTSPAVTLHRAAEQAAQERVPLGSRQVGVVHIRIEGHPGSPDSAATHSVPLYQARVAYRRPNAYKERPSLCIVDDKTATSSKHSRHHHRQRGGNAVDATVDAMRVYFVDLVSLTSMSRVLLRCARTGELLAPTPLFCRYNPSATSAVASTSLAAAADVNAGRRDAPVEAKQAWSAAKAAMAANVSGNAHAQHHRRRVVMLPLSAAGESFDLVSVIMKRARNAAETH